MRTNTMKTSNRQLLAAVASSIAAHAFMTFFPGMAQVPEALHGMPRGASPTVAFNYVATGNSVSMRAPTSAAEQYGQPRTNSRRPPYPGPVDAKIHGSAAENAPWQLGGETFFPTSQLSRPAQPAVPVALESAELEMAPLSGVSVLTVWIDSRGNVVQATIESSDVPGQFAQLAAEAFRKTPFIPGERNGGPVGTVMRIEVRYEDLVDLPV